MGGVRGGKNENTQVWNSQIKKEKVRPRAEGVLNNSEEEEQWYDSM